MNPTQLFSGDDDRGVSPVIGVILMVAITVILAAVIASFVLGLGDQQDVTPTAQFTFDYQAGDDILSVTHDGGDTIAVDELFVRGSGFASPGNGEDMTGAGQWDGTTSSTQGSTSAVVAGDSVDIGVSSDYEIRVVYESRDGGNSATLAQDEGPDA